MGKSVRKSLSVVKSEVKEPENLVPKVNLFDGASLKRALDEAAVEALTSAGYKEDHYVSNVKIGASIFLCLLAAIAHFWPQKFPHNWAVLAVCVTTYGLGTFALNLFTSRAEADTFVFLRSKSSPSEPLLRVSSKLPRFSYQYELIISGSNGDMSTDLDIQNYFTSDGQLADRIYKGVVAGLLHKFQDYSAKKQL